MLILLCVLTIVLSLALVASGVGKLTRQPAVVESMTAVHFPVDRIWMLAVLEIAGAAGMVVGLWVMPLGVAAAVGVVLYFAGAVVFHLRARNYVVAPPAALGLLAVAVVVLQFVAD